MKNLNGLYNAMKLVESACEEGEITIIGQGAMPTAQELLAKCVDYINHMYGCDILNQVIVKQTAQPTPYEEDDDEWEDDEEEEEEMCYIHISTGWDKNVQDRLEKNAPYLCDAVIDNIIDELDSIVDDLNDTIEEDYDRIYTLEKITDILDETLSHMICCHLIEELADIILDTLELNMD